MGARLLPDAAAVCFAMAVANASAGDDNNGVPEALNEQTKTINALIATDKVETASSVFSGERLESG